MIIEDITWPDGTVDGREILKATFDEWLAHVFDHPPQKGDWWWNEDAIDWNVPASDTVAFLTKTFDESATVLKPFTDTQVASGLDYISNMACSEIARKLLLESVPWSMRIKAIASIRKLYNDLFAVRCSPVLSHLLKTSGPPLNGVCYMWWDVFPIVPEPDKDSQKEIDQECLAVMEFALALKSEACRESALHGLGHWAGGYLERVHQIVDRCIAENPDVRPELLEYARNAREGTVQ